tara:strand:+ start:375 stop:797 length:423 start_codon:yes stop_codon:yes gene_type:complete
MNITEARKKLADFGIHQLNKGESLADAIRYVDGEILRVGYKVKHDGGTLMTENQVIANENKIAFSRSFTPASYFAGDVESIDDICKEDDFREEEGRGSIANCYYCGWCIRVDGDDEDYSINEPETHCNDCLSDAIMNLAM